MNELEFLKNKVEIQSKIIKLYQDFEYQMPCGADEYVDGKLKPLLEQLDSIGGDYPKEFLNPEDLFNL